MSAIREAYERFKHLDTVFSMVWDSDGTENTDPFHPAARDMWQAIKADVEAEDRAANEGKVAK